MVRCNLVDSAAKRIIFGRAFRTLERSGWLKTVLDVSGRRLQVAYCSILRTTITMVRSMNVASDGWELRNERM